tara:strand:+ start:3976 stop:4662 length:687 start_codon:yes stop_codon:yes gene_type:complete
MSDYTKSVNFASKDALSTGDANKIVKGTEIDTEFNNIATAVATKRDTTSTVGVSQGGTGITAAGTSGNVLMSNGSAFASSALIPTGSVMLFYQASAPTGWTKSTTHNDKAIRVVSGSGGGTGGSVAFETAFASQTPAGSIGGNTASHTLTISEIPSHSHGHKQDGGVFAAGSSPTSSLHQSATSSSTGKIENTGGGGGHTHGATGLTFTGSAINLDVSYVDVIICTKS